MHVIHDLTSLGGGNRNPPLKKKVIIFSLIQMNNLRLDQSCSVSGKARDKELGNVSNTDKLLMSAFQNRFNVHIVYFLNTKTGFENPC